MPPPAGHRLLLVHAHPDDETITTGATMAHYAARGVAVTLLTCTLGEEGEILVPAWAELAADRADQLGGLRIGELAGAMRALGVADHRFLGAAGRYRDSGMLGTPANEHPRAFWRAAADPEVLAAAVADAVRVVRDVRPHVVVTYDDAGDYGHPDHVMAHRVTTAAVTAAADASYGTGPAWSVPKLYWTATPRSVLTRGHDAARGRPDVPFESPAVPAFGVPDDVVTTVIDASAHAAAKRAGLRAHATQILVHDDFFALSNRIAREIDGVEHFRLVAGASGDRDEHGHERDLFAGLA
ncbi:N-acetyl-1-D-myo-inositol-2-amino-2-deoxy-alpha-D-glucopyranoside deacetylase [Jatrophihabitans endophyticus]|uniref:1D-myo-inositol 2-acetamido-2-deoxy-alpha-D-glucopyranoside deacetylase n=1 Tax=Jatrophihabitans endophyticus TaxID=1206085 RepID=A0A1M5T9H9_9ACTN|nr:N-acetyl-1-D-myo-inositol-2-amino-2-deoxy-alpha-D-glucopyranoside deacetylase [Jatrophihabitans endophyticus]SHH47346.1 N-acetyl-1-D-myo-inositol-2-amino-2-deoxy-alpha-D-glucopyranoside deacetylase [Jatrophihabitans endophyticus]